MPPNATPAAPPTSPAQTYHFILSGLSDSGREVVERIQAPTPQQAIAAFTARGHTRVKLVADDPGRITLSSAQTRARTARVLSPRQQAALAQGGGGRWRLVIKTYRSAAIPLVACVVLFVQRHLTHHAWAWPDAILIGVLLLPLLLLVTGGVRVAALHAVERASLEGDHEKVLRLLPALARAMRPMGPAAVDLHITSERAKALAGLGRLDEALREMEALECRPDIPRYRYLLRLGAVYSIARDREEALECYREAAALDSADSGAPIAEAEILAVHLHRPAEARAALARARALPIPETTKTLLAYVDGAIALDERRTADAVAAFDTALPPLRALAGRSPSGQGLLALVNALYATALAQLGNRPAAAKALAQAEPILANKPQYADLLGRAKREVGAV